MRIYYGEYLNTSMKMRWWIYLVHLMWATTWCQRYVNDEYQTLYLLIVFGIYVWWICCQDASFVPNGSTNAPMAEGLNGAEVAQRLNQAVCFTCTFLLGSRYFALFSQSLPILQKRKCYTGNIIFLLFIVCVLSNVLEGEGVSLGVCLSKGEVLTFGAKHF